MKRHIDFGTTMSGAPCQVPLDDLRFGSLLVGPTGKGKTRLAMSVCDQLLTKAPRVGQLIIDGKGDLFALARRKWCARGLGKHLVTVDPNQDDFVTGLNFTSPWIGDEERQASRLADLSIRIAEADPTIVVKMRKWTASAFSWLLASKNYWSDGMLLLDSLNNSARHAVLPAVPESPARRDLEWLCRQVASGTSTATKLVDDQVASSVHRFRTLWENPRLRRMFGTSHSIDLARLLLTGHKVLANFSPVKINFTEQRIATLALLNETLHVMYNAGESEGLRVLITIDDPRRAHGEELEALITQGRSFGFGVQLCVQTCDMLRDPKTRDPRVLEAVLSCCRTKGAFGGLSHDDATKLSEALWAHHLDPDRKQFVQETPRQLQHVVQAQSRSHGDSRGQAVSVQSARSVATGESETLMTSRGSAHGYSYGRSSVSGSGSGLGSVNGTSASESLALDAALSDATSTTGRMEASSRTDSSFNAAGSSDAQSDVDIETEGSASATSRVEAESVAKGTALSAGTIDAVTEGPMVAPSEVFYERIYQIEPLETQLARHQSALVSQPDRTLTIAFGTDRPNSIRTPDFPDPKITALQASEMDRRRVGLVPHYASPEDVDKEIEERHAKLLGSPSGAEVIEEDPVPTDQVLRERLALELPMPVKKRARPRTRRR